ncbi:BolA-like protein [Leptospira inadai serovar Lyme str. 10]|uniref:BolA-like protein n=2 Tax=Leptospira inadai serovar Lyme TaxID=293084 RepID=V6HBZ4_9LEPT|nr:BolA family protein [Leptospira inadai]EQA37042.1 BolA-like protein [Leptospira inadai serovar Lyme str. 10]PNV76581.1 BolA family transcriptional regulator [Leptospira inadai serovar Lyme]
MVDSVEEIEFILRSTFSPSVLEVEDFSAEHAGHGGNPEGLARGTHIRIKIVSESFREKSLLAQHREIYSVLNPILQSKGIHALELKTAAP